MYNHCRYVLSIKLVTGVDDKNENKTFLEWLFFINFYDMSLISQNITQTIT